MIESLAVTYARLGDLPESGAWWFLSDSPDDDPDAAAGLAAFRARMRGPVARAHALPIRRPTAEYPPAAQRRVNALRDELAAIDYDWSPPSRPSRLRQSTDPRRSEAAVRDFRDAAGTALVAGLVLGNVALYVLGLVTFLRWLW